jgi:hypothetical protein
LYLPSVVSQLRPPINILLWDEVVLHKAGYRGRKRICKEQRVLLVCRTLEQRMS